MVGQFAEVCKRRRLKVNPGLECEVHVDGFRLDQVQMEQNVVGRW